MDLGSEAHKEAHDVSGFLGVECVMVVDGESPDPGRVGTCPPFLEWSLGPCLSQKVAVSGLEMGEEQEHKEEDLCKASVMSAWRVGTCHVGELILTTAETHLSTV